MIGQNSGCIQRLFTSERHQFSAILGSKPYTGSSWRSLWCLIESLILGLARQRQHLPIMVCGPLLANKSCINLEKCFKFWNDTVFGLKCLQGTLTRTGKELQIPWKLQTLGFVVDPASTWPIHPSKRGFSLFSKPLFRTSSLPRFVLEDSHELELYGRM